MIGGSLCSGSGGLDLGLERALGIEWAWHAEIDAAAAKLLDHHWPGTPNLGDFTAVDWTTVEPVDLVSAGFPCFVAGTLILTRDGYRPIESLAVGDLVLTHERRWRPVSFCHETPDAPVRRVCAPGVNLVCTDEHPFYARRGRYDEQGRRLGFDAPEWRDAADLAPEDFLGQTLPPVEAVESRPLAFWRLIGRYLADGWMVDRRGRRNGRVVICCANDELDDLRSLVADAGYRAAVERGESASKLHVTRGDLYDFVRSFGRLAHGKMLPGFVHSLGPEESEAILAGYLDGDGYRDERGRCWRATTVSEQLAYGLALLAQRARGVVASVHPYERAGETEIEGRTVRQRPEWQVRIPFSNRSCFVEDGYGWKKVKRNERLPDRVTVYNIAVEEDESYVANGAIVHNCPDYSLAGRRAGIDGEHGQVWHSVARAVRALRPALVVLENVDGIRSAAGPVGGGPGDTALGVVLADLADLGYRWAYDRIRAADVGAPHGRLRWFCVAALPSAADAVRVGDDADGRVRRRDPGAPGRRGSAPSAVPAGEEVDVAEDALEDGPGARPGRVALLPTPSASDATGAEGETRDRRREEGSTGGPSLRDLPKLLPTPTAGDGKASGSRNLEGSRAHPGVSLTDAVQTGDSTTPRLLPTPVASDANDGPSNVPGPHAHPSVAEDAVRLLPTPTSSGTGNRDDKANRHLGHGPTLNDAAAEIAEMQTDVRLLPTPQAADGVGGRMERGAMESDGKRPSGHKATLPLPTAVEMREDLSGTPFAQAADDDQLVLLPTPVANPENPETGTDTLGRPNRGRALLPTPTVESATHSGRRATKPGQQRHLSAEVPLLPTPTTQDAANTGGDSQRDRNSDPLNVVAADALLPTPQTGNRKSRKAMTASTENGRRSGGGNSSPPDGRVPAELPGLEQVAELADYEELPPATREIVDSFDAPNVQWGVYGAAIARWEQVFGEPAPAPTDEKGRLAPDFVRWMLGYPAGWFDVAGLPRTKLLRCLGNSVQVQCGEAVGYWLAGLLASGILLDEG